MLACEIMQEPTDWVAPVRPSSAWLARFSKWCCAIIRESTCLPAALHGRSNRLMQFRTAVRCVGVIWLGCRANSWIVCAGRVRNCTASDAPTRNAHANATCARKSADTR